MRKVPISPPTGRGLHTFKDSYSGKIIVSPPLISVDLPDTWGSKSEHSDSITPHSFCKLLLLSC